MGGSPNDIRISDMRPTLVEPPMYKPKVVLLGKDKKGTQRKKKQNTKRLTRADTCAHMHTLSVVYCKSASGHVVIVSTN